MQNHEALLDAWVTAEREGNAEASSALLTEDFVGIGPMGFQLPRVAWLQRLTGGDLHYDQLELKELDTRDYGDCRIITARWNAKGTARGQSIPEAARVTLVAVRQDKDWSLASIHYSFVAGTPGAPSLS